MDRTPGWPLRALAALLPAVLLAFALPVRAQEAGRTLVLPFRSLGISDTTTAVFASLLSGELEGHGVPVLSAGSRPLDEDSARDACDQPECAASIARAAGAGRVVFGSLSRLGGKVIVRVRAMDVDAAVPDYSDQLTAVSEEDLDVIARRIAEGMAAGEADASRALVGTITEHETETPRRRAASIGVGFRGGFLIPVGNSYGGADHLSGLRMVTRFETDRFYIETTPALGLMWGDGSLEWTLVEVLAGRIFSRGDWAPDLGAGLGVHAVHLENRRSDPNLYPYYYPYANTQDVTTLTADFGGGVLLFRTYEFQLAIDVRYHVVFSSFDELGSKGAHGLMVGFGTSRSGEARARRGPRTTTFWH